MTQLGEAVTAAILTDAVAECPFKTPTPPTVDKESEDPAKDDSHAVDEVQENDGGKLGRNVVGGSSGSEGTWNVLGGDPPVYQRLREDTARTGVKAHVKADGKDYPFTVAAHHCIPGEASLYPSALYEKFMEKGGEMELNTSTGTKNYKLTEHIGYNVNGSHNGVWLPGSYAIRTASSPVAGKSWGDLSDGGREGTWKLSYMAAVVRAADGQFHDAHTHYNTHVRGMLNKLALVVISHIVACEECQSKTELPPPYVLKQRLYRLSRSLRLQTKARPRRWKITLMTSDQVRTDVLANPLTWSEFLKHYDQTGL
jgi:hypothetical protein